MRIRIPTRNDIAHFLIVAFVVCTLWYIRAWLWLFEAVVTLFGSEDE